MCAQFPVKKNLNNNELKKGNTYCFMRLKRNDITILSQKQCVATKRTNINPQYGSDFENYCEEELSYCMSVHTVISTVEILEKLYW